MLNVLKFFVFQLSAYITEFLFYVIKSLMQVQYFPRSCDFGRYKGCCIKALLILRQVLCPYAPLSWKTVAS